MTVSQMPQHYEPMSPIDVERKLREAGNALWKAERQLREARDAETDAEIVYQRAYRRALLSQECPRVERSGATVAERDAWVQLRCEAEWEAWRIAKTACEAAQDHVRTQRDITSTFQSIASLVRQAYSLAGTAA